MVTKQDTGRATISEIAREAGVSVPTVSKVLNGHAHVAAATRARVEEIIARRDYARRPAKRSKKAGLIDLVFPGLGSEWALEIIEGVERVAQDAGYGTVVSSLSLDGSRIRPWLANLAERKPDGLLLAVYELDPKQIRRIKSLGIPVVLIDPVGQPGPDLMTVGAANWDGAYSGHRVPAGAGEPADRHDRRPGGPAVQQREGGRVPVRAAAGRCPGVRQPVVQMAETAMRRCSGIWTGTRSSRSGLNWGLSWWCGGRRRRLVRVRPSFGHFDSGASMVEKESGKFLQTPKYFPARNHPVCSGRVHKNSDAAEIVLPFMSPSRAAHVFLLSKVKRLVFVPAMST
jgi:hypothetical protein